MFRAAVGRMPVNDYFLGAAFETTEQFNLREVLENAECWASGMLRHPSDPHCDQGLIEGGFYKRFEQHQIDASITELAFAL